MDIQLHYTEYGNGTPLILLHGNGEHSGYFYHQIQHFSSRFRVIAVDTRGHGLSPRGVAPFTIQQFAYDLGDLMDELNIRDAIILGFSDGANIAMKFALTYPNRVIALILNGGNLNAFGVKLSLQLPMTLQYLQAKRYAGQSKEALEEMEMLGLMVNDPNIKAEALHNIHAPTLVIAGTDDVIKAGQTRKIAKYLPNSKLVFVPGDHFIAANNPVEFNSAVDQFLYEYL